MNGEEVRDAHTKMMLHEVGAQLRNISQFMTLEEGDLIFTGTPSPGPVRPGDDLHASLTDFSTGETLCTVDLSCIEKQL